MDILEDLYYGNLFPHEKCATFSDEQKETFEKYKDCNREISEISEREIFLNGFRLGARIIIDVVNN